MVLDISTAVGLASVEVILKYQRNTILLNLQKETLYRCCKLLLSIVWRGEESGLKEKEKHKRDVACLEPFLEAAPQVTNS